MTDREIVTTEDKLAKARDYFERRKIYRRQPQKKRETEQERAARYRRGLDAVERRIKAKDAAGQTLTVVEYAIARVLHEEAQRAAGDPVVAADGKSV